jgi:hypothetical protein
MVKAFGFPRHATAESFFETTQAWAIPHRCEKGSPNAGTRTYRRITNCPLIDRIASRASYTSPSAH